METNFNNIAESVLKNWQKITELMAKILKVKVALITEVDNSYIKVIVGNKDINNPYKKNEVYKLAGLYCEETIKTKNMLEINNATKENKWVNAPEIDYNLISYLGFPIIKPDNTIMGTICVLDDEERKFNKVEKELLYQLKKIIEGSLKEIELNKKIKQSELLMQAGLDSLSAHIVILDQYGVIKFTNKAWRNFAKQNGADRKKCCEGINYLELAENVEEKNSKEAPIAARGIKQVMNGKKELFTLEYPCHSPDEKRWFKMRVTPFIGSDPYTVIIAHENITERKLKEEEMEYCSFHDLLTGLYNRRYFEQEIERLNQSRRLPISIIIGDLDGLKYINDNYGHKMGDTYIIKAGEVIKEVTRGDDIIARIGGDEFAVLLAETDSHSVKNICKRIEEKCKKYNDEKQLPEPLSISLGTATMIEKDQSLDDLFTKADQNMYKNKEKKRKKS